jgi:DNA polymerase-3 subunit epsilon
MTTIPSRYVILDCETTGFGGGDRIIELAAVTIDGKSLETVDEFDTLINPQRDVGRTNIHGITASMVAAAPTFAEIAATVARLLDGAVLVAHNLPFDARMVRQEFERESAEFDAGRGVCTYRLSGLKLALAAESHGIPLDHHHRALADARVAAGLFRKLLDGGPAGPARVATRSGTATARTLRREAVGGTAPLPLRKLLARACYPSSLDACVTYFELVDWALADGTMSSSERDLLDTQIRALGLTPDQVKAMHEAYFASIRRAVERDGTIVAAERSLLERVAKALGVTDAGIPAESPKPTATAAAFRPGMRICFTGAATDRAGRPIDRMRLESLAARIGCQPVDAVSKKGCDLLVAADPASLSGKAEKARQYGIPLMGVADFLAKADH